MASLQEVCGLHSLLPNKPKKRNLGSTLPNKAAEIDPISVEEKDNAEREIQRHVKERFKEEIAILQATGSELSWKRMRRQSKERSS